MKIEIKGLGRYPVKCFITIKGNDSCTGTEVIKHYVKKFKFSTPKHVLQSCTTFIEELRSANPLCRFDKVIMEMREI